jgi:hypothetical protein
MFKQTIKNKFSYILLDRLVFWLQIKTIKE